MEMLEYTTRALRAMLTATAWCDGVRSFFFFISINVSF